MGLFLQELCDEVFYRHVVYTTGSLHVTYSFLFQINQAPREGTRTGLKLECHSMSVLF